MVICEPHLSRKTLLILSGNIGEYHRNIINFLNYSDGKNNLNMISKIIKINLNKTKKIYRELIKNKLIKTL